MKLVPTNRTDYGLRALIYLAGAEGPWTKAAEISVAMAIPTGFLQLVLQELQRSGLVTSRSGPNGGYCLARPAASITICEIVESLEGPLDTGECALRGGPCHWEDVCALHRVWSEARVAPSGSASSRPRWLTWRQTIVRWPTGPPAPLPIRTGAGVRRRGRSGPIVPAFAANLDLSGQARSMLSVSRRRVTGPSTTVHRGSRSRVESAWLGRHTMTTALPSSARSSRASATAAHRGSAVPRALITTSARSIRSHPSPPTSGQRGRPCAFGPGHHIMSASRRPKTFQAAYATAPSSPSKSTLRPCGGSGRRLAQAERAVRAEIPLRG